MPLFDNAKAQMEHIGVFIFGFIMIAIVVVAILAQKSMRGITGPAYLVNDSYGGQATGGTIIAANVSNGLIDPALGLGAYMLLLIAGLAIIAVIGVIAAKSWGR
jgi:hypothetical protein